MNKSVLKKILSAFAAIFVLYIAFMIYTSFYGNPVKYYRAKSQIKNYIEQNYKDVLKLEGVSYNWKMNTYMGKVTDTKDPRCKSFIEYFWRSDSIYDDYHFRTMSNMEDEVGVTISTIIETSCGLSPDDLKISPQIEIPKYKYRIFDKHDPANPVNLVLSLNVNYSNIDEFSEGVYKVLSSLYASNLKFNKIDIYSFIPGDGNSAYSISLGNGVKISSVDELKKLSNEKWMGK